ncbi:MAG TPA: hypothetical protein VJO99_17590 [Burkholderiaceae bacterium]|nr:hypothetical protein [Burkholderiaceae bacterium]
MPTDPIDSNERGTLAAFDTDPLRTLLLQLNHAPGASRDTQEGGSPHIAIPSGEQEDTDGSGLQAVILQTLGMALTVGSVWWALRITGLLGALMASLPVWRQIDLLPVLADDEDEDDPPSDPDDDDDESARDEAAVGRHLFVEPGARA